jgi:hypothetical protein
MRLIDKLQDTNPARLDVENVHETVGHCLVSKIRTAYKVTDRADRIRFQIEADQRLRRLPRQRKRCDNMIHEIFGEGYRGPGRPCLAPYAQPFRPPAEHISDIAARRSECNFAARYRTACRSAAVILRQTSIVWLPPPTQFIAFAIRRSISRRRGKPS